MRNLVDATNGVLLFFVFSENPFFSPEPLFLLPLFFSVLFFSFKRTRFSLQPLFSSMQNPFPPEKTASAERKKGAQTKQKTGFREKGGCTEEKKRETERKRKKTFREKMHTKK